jgi:Ser/Thr protein kinase RdoA (MazF antagonist)
MDPIAGAWSNSVFRLEVGCDAYAVKELRNPWADPGWTEWLSEAWAFECAAIEAGVVAPEPIVNPSDGGCLADVEREGGAGVAAVRVHRWVEGAPASLGPATRELARWIGQTIARLHQIDRRARNRAVFPSLNVDNAGRWAELVEAAERAGAPWADLAAEVSGSVEAIARLASAGGERVGDEIMTHGDVDQKNIVISPTAGPHLCDWDVACPLVPSRDLAIAAMSMATWKRLDVARQVIDAYRAADGPVDRLTVEDLGQPMMYGIDWIVLNIERALHLRPVTEPEAALGTQLVPQLLTQLPHRLAVAHRIEELLGPC